MSGNFLFAAMAALLLARPTAAAEVDVTDAHGHPLAEAVVELARTPAASGVAAIPLPAESIIDQRHETFLPLVTLIPKGGRVIFTNNDSTMHQVYSFSQIRQFAFEIDEGQRSQPVVFDKPGVAAIGCNIHDQMITYVYVADQPWAAISDKGGRAGFSGLSPGNYRGTVWHPRQMPGAPRISFLFQVADANTRMSVTVPVSAAPEKKSMHMQMY